MRVVWEERMGEENPFESGNGTVFRVSFQLSWLVCPRSRSEAANAAEIETARNEKTN